MSRLGQLGSCAVFILTALFFIDLGMGLIFGAGLFDMIGGVQSPLAVALADRISSGNVLVFYSVVAFLILFVAWIMSLSAGYTLKKVRR